MFNAKKVKDQCVQWIRDWFEQNGKGCNAVLGISGGKDSSICAALCADAVRADFTELEKVLFQLTTFCYGSQIVAEIA